MLVKACRKGGLFRNRLEQFERDLRENNVEEEGIKLALKFVDIFDSLLEEQLGQQAKMRIDSDFQPNIQAESGTRSNQVIGFLLNPFGWTNPFQFTIPLISFKIVEMSQPTNCRLISILRSIYRELRHYDFGPGVGVGQSDTWKYIMDIARRNRLTSQLNCQEGSEWGKIAETYLIYTKSSRLYGDMLEESKMGRGGSTLMDAIKNENKASLALFQLKRKRRPINSNKNNSSGNDDDRSKKRS